MKGNSLFLNLAAFLKNTRMVGPGLRDAVWVQGCRIRCPGCANQAYLPHEKRVLMPVKMLIMHFKNRENKIDGCSILGGEPTEQPEAVVQLLRGVKALGLSTVVFSGRVLEDLQKDSTCHEILANTDLLIDGPYIQSLQDTTLHWRGSTNQRFHILNNYWGKENIVPCDKPNGEIIISNKRLLLNGIGTQRIKFASLIDRCIRKNSES